MDLLHSMTLSRRGLLRAGSLVAVAGAVGMPALARAPLPTDQAPTWYRFKLGSAVATVVSDGALTLPDAHDAFLALPASELDAMLASNFLAAKAVKLEQNTLVLNTGDRVIIFDNGMGISKAFGDGLGRLLVTLKQAGIDPKDVDALVMSHAHIDHCGGIAAADGSLNFPNAQLYLNEDDYRYWTDEAKTGALKAFYEQTKHNLVPNKDRITWIKDGQEILPGVHAMLAPGHTVGHTIFMISVDNQQLCYTADLAHHPVVLLERPLTEFVFDTDPKQSAQTRVKMLTMLAANRTPILAYHFPWPGIGHIAKQGEGFHFIPANIATAQIAPV